MLKTCKGARLLRAVHKSRPQSGRIV